MRRHRELVKLVAALLALLAWMAFIFYMSAKTGGASGGMSESVAAWLAQTFCPDWASMAPAARAELLSQMSLPVRKGAHVAEYAVLAALAFIAFWQMRTAARAMRHARAGASADADAGTGASAGASEGADEGAGAPAGENAGMRASADGAAARAVFLTALASFAFSAFYAASDEFHQLFVPGRAGLFSDVLIDSCGAALGSALAALVAWRGTRRAQRREGGRCS